MICSDHVKIPSSDHLICLVVPCLVVMLRPICHPIGFFLTPSLVASAGGFPGARQLDGSTKQISEGGHKAPALQQLLLGPNFANRLLAIFKAKINEQLLFHAVVPCCSMLFHVVP